VMALKVRDVMSTDVCLVGPDDTIQKAAVNMGQYDAGIMPVAENDRMVGMITDRDIAVRAVGEGRGPDAKVREIMSAEVKYCYDDEDAGHVSDNMADLQVRRLPVVNREKRLVGIVSVADIARRQAPKKTGEAVRGISEPGGAHSQTAGKSKEKVGA
jgi:CBS domain-containing protein